MSTAWRLLVAGDICGIGAVWRDVSGRVGVRSAEPTPRRLAATTADSVEERRSAAARSDGRRVPSELGDSDFAT